MQFNYAAESYALVRGEIEPLLLEHWREVAGHPDIELKPDWPLYETLARQGRLRIFTARCAGALVGYSVHVVQTNMHYSTSKQALEDILFVGREYRRGPMGMKLIKFADDELKREGVQVAIRHVKMRPELNYGPVLARLNYAPMDQLWTRRLDREEI